MEKNSVGDTSMFCTLFKTSSMGVSVFSERSTAGIGRSDRIVLGESSCGNPEACLSVPNAFLTS